MIVYKNEGGLSSNILDRPMLGFWDTEKVGGISNELFPLLIMTSKG